MNEVKAVKCYARFNCKNFTEHKKMAIQFLKDAIKVIEESTKDQLEHDFLSDDETIEGYVDLQGDYNE